MSRFGFCIALLACTLMLSSSAIAQTTTYSSEETIPVPPASSYMGSGGGDGWDVSLSPTTVFNVFHHNGVMSVACHKQSDASACAPVRTIVDGSGRNFSTSGHSGTYLDQDTLKLYVYGTRSDGTGGVVCVDTTTLADDAGAWFCGFTALTTVGEAVITSVPMQVGNHLYSFNWGGSSQAGTRNKLMCFNLTTKAACTGQPYTLDVAAGSVSHGTFPEPATAVIGDQVLVPIVVDGVEQIGCWDDSLQAECAGTWPLSIAGLGYVGSYGSPFPLLDSSGGATGFCLPTPSDPCYTLAGAATATPPSMTTAVGYTVNWNGQAVTIGPRMYLATWNGDTVRCYDYSAMAGCANFPRSSPGAGLVYTVNRDPQRPACLWINADNGSAQIQNFDAFSGGACGEGSIRVLSSQLVVTEEECQPATYRKFEVIAPPRSDYTDGTVGFADSGGGDTGIPAQPIDANGAVDLTGLGLESVDSPQFLITLNGATPSEVTVKLTWDNTYDPDCIDDETEVTKTPTTTTTSLSGGGHNGTSITVQSGTPVTDHSTLAGEHSGDATGTVTYTVYSDADCSSVAGSGGTKTISTPGTLPDSSPVTLSTPGTYYWRAEYSGDDGNFTSKSACGAEVETVTAGPTEGPPGDATCSDGIDNDDDGFTDLADTDCQGGPPPSGKCFGKTATITGNGVVNGTPGDDVILTGPGPDTVKGGGGNDTICSHQGDDFVRGGSGNDQIAGGMGKDNLGGQAGNDTMSGGFGNDYMAGFSGDDVLRGDGDNDRLHGDGGVDRLFGVDGNDTLNGGADAPDTCNGGNGTDKQGAAGGCEVISNIP